MHFPCHRGINIICLGFKINIITLKLTQILDSNLNFAFHIHNHIFKTKKKVIATLVIYFKFQKSEFESVYLFFTPIFLKAKKMEMLIQGTSNTDE